jgi:hypothetical protein
MSKCYHCGKILSDAWMIKQGASLMGKSGGPLKARSRKQAQVAAKKRWAKRDQAQNAEYAARLAKCSPADYVATLNAQQAADEFTTLCAELAAEAALLGKPAAAEAGSKETKPRARGRRIKSAEDYRAGNRERQRRYQAKKLAAMTATA